MRVYVMIPDEPLDRRSLFIVGKEADAKSLVDCGMFYTYEVEEVLNHEDVERYRSEYMEARQYGY